MSSPTPHVPSGWYPDPAGERRWRVWTGTSWSSMTRDYGPPIGAIRAPGASIEPDAGDHELLGALSQAVRYGVAGIFGGIGMLVSIVVHWPGTAQPASLVFCRVALGVAIALIAVGSVCFAFAGRAFVGRWTWWSVLPGVNVIAVSALVGLRLGVRPGVRVAFEVILMVIFASWYRHVPGLAVVPAVVALGNSRWINALIERLRTTPTVGPLGAP